MMATYRKAFEQCPVLTFIDVRVEGQPFFDRYLRPKIGSNEHLESSRISIERDAPEWGQHAIVGLSETGSSLLHKSHQ